MEDTTMTDPTPTRLAVHGQYVTYLGHQVISVLADPDARAEYVTEMRAALVQCVRDADTLRQARELAMAINQRRRQHTDTRLTLSRLLTLLVDGGGDG